MRSFLFLLAVMAAANLQLACVSTGSGSTSDVQMRVFRPESLPLCDFEERGRIALDTPAWVTTAERNAASQDTREVVKRMGGDAVIRVDMPREYIVIKFTEPGCQE
jgi:hypothetical protein